MYDFISCTYVFFFFFTATPTTEIYTLSLHDALPIYFLRQLLQVFRTGHGATEPQHVGEPRHGSAFARSHRLHHVGQTRTDRKSTRLNSSHVKISYAVFCLKKKKKTHERTSATISNTV